MNRQPIQSAAKGASREICLDDALVFSQRAIFSHIFVWIASRITQSRGTNLTPGLRLMPFIAMSAWASSRVGGQGDQIRLADATCLVRACGRHRQFNYTQMSKREPRGGTPVVSGARLTIDANGCVALGCAVAPCAVLARAVSMIWDTALVRKLNVAGVSIS
jgi:hypothetical protein